MTTPRPKKSDYSVQEDGGVIFTGDPENYSAPYAESLVQGLELGSEPAATGNPKAPATKETAAAKAVKANPKNIEMGAL